MPGKTNRLIRVVSIIPVLLACLCMTHLQAELVKTSKMEALDKKNKFSIERDIFSPIKKNYSKQTRKERIKLPPPPPPVEKPDEGIEKKERNVVNEIKGSIAYEGYALRNSKKLALLSINGEFRVAKDGDQLTEEIKVVTVERTVVTLEVEAQQIEINLKDEEENGDKDESDENY